MFSRVKYDKYQKFKEKMNRVDTMEGLEFEEFTCEILKENGYKNIKKTQASGDFGVDVIACKDNKKYAIQCKRYKSTLGIAAIQQVHTGKDYYNADVAVVLTTSSFTSSAIKAANRVNVKLWDGVVLQKLMKNALNSIYKEYEKEKRARHAEEKYRQQQFGRYDRKTGYYYGTYREVNETEDKKEDYRKQEDIERERRRKAKEEAQQQAELEREQRRKVKEEARQQAELERERRRKTTEEKKREYERQKQIDRNKRKYAKELKRQELNEQKRVKQEYNRERRKKFIGKLRSIDYIGILKKICNAIHNIFFWIMSVVLLICAIYEIIDEKNVKLIISYLILGILINPKIDNIFSKKFFKIKNWHIWIIFLLGMFISGLFIG